MAQLMMPVLRFYALEALRLKTVLRLLLSSILALSVLAAKAQNIPDPTRPPDFILAPVGAAGSEPSGPVLQSVLIAADRRLAIISGKTVKLYEKYADQTVIKITETEVVLRNGKALQTLKLFPDFEKKSSRNSTSPKADTARP